MSRERKRVLADHNRRGKVFVPPFLQLGEMHDVSWVRTILPELLWIAVIQRRQGLREGVRTITESTRIARNHLPDGNSKILGAASAFRAFEEVSAEKIRGDLLQAGELLPLQSALEPLLRLYPECPLRILYATPPPSDEVRPGDVEFVKSLVRTLFEKGETEAIRAQATFISLAFDADVLKVVKGSGGLENFPAVEDYPHTEEARRVAASIRAAVPSFFGQEAHYPKDAAWPGYFWTRGLEIDPCEWSVSRDE